MPTILSHPAVPLALGLGLGYRIIPRPLLAAGVILSMLPDLDVLMLHMGVSYGNSFGHRGFSHSILITLIFALAGGSLAHRFHGRFRIAFWFLFLSMVSHGLLDCITNGGLGVALFWPFSDERFFAFVQPLEVAPLRIERFFSIRGVEVLLSEMIWVWLPALGVGIALRMGKGGVKRYATGRAVAKPTIESVS